MRKLLLVALMAIAPQAWADTLTHRTSADADYGRGGAVAILDAVTTSDERLTIHRPEYGGYTAPWRVYAPDGSYRESQLFAAPTGFYAYSSDFNASFETTLTMDKGFGSILLTPWSGIIKSAMPFRFSDGAVTSSLFLEDTSTGERWDVSSGGEFFFDNAPTTLKLSGSFIGTPGRGLIPGTPGCGSFDCMIPAQDKEMAFRIALQALPVPQPVPEPETYALLLAGLAAVAIRRRRA